MAWDIGPYELIQTTPTIITQPAANLVTAVSGTATFTVLARGQAPLNYQWKKNGVNLTNGGIVSGATSATLTLTGVGVADAGTYTVEVNNALGPAALSTGSVLTVGATAPSITTQPVASQSVTWGTTVTISAAATGVPAPNFQWRRDGVNLTNGGIVSGATSATLTLTGVTGDFAGTYTVVADNTVPPAATSNGSVLTVNGIPVTITTQPTSQTVQVNTPASFSVSATGTPAPSYQWNRNGTPIAGATGSTYTIPSTQVGDAGNYTVTVTNTVGPVTSTTAVLQVNTTPGPSVAVQPLGLTVGTGRTASFSFIAPDAVSFQWQESTDGGNTWTNLVNNATYSGVTTTTLTIKEAPLSLHNRRYRALAGNITGSVVTNAVVLGVSPPVFPGPADVAVNAAGNLLVTDLSQNVVQSVNPASLVANLLAGAANQQGATNGTGSAALFRQPGGSVLDAQGNLYVVDTGNSLIRRITPTGTVTTVAGSATDQGHRDGQGTAAWFNAPTGITIDVVGNLFVADTGNSVIRKIDPQGNVTTLAGHPGSRGSVDATGAEARFNGPTGIAADPVGTLYVADTLNQTIRRVTPTGTVTTWVGLTGVTGMSDGGGALALFNHPHGVTLSGFGPVYVSDSGNATIRHITVGGHVSTFAGLPTISGLQDGVGMNAWFNKPLGLRLDSNGNLYVADNGNAAIRRITPSGAVTTLAITQGTTPVAPAPTPTPPPAPPPAPPPSSSGGGGGAPSLWFLGALSLLWLSHRWVRRQASTTG